MFSNANIPFTFHDPLHNYLYMHGIITTETIAQPNDIDVEICRFTSPFIQHCLYDALSGALVASSSSVLPLHPLDTLDDVFDAPVLNLLALLQRYKAT